MLYVFSRVYTVNYMYSQGQLNTFCNCPNRLVQCIQRHLHILY